MKNLFDEIYRMGTTDDEHRLYHRAAAVRMCWMTSARSPH